MIAQLRARLIEALKELGIEPDYIQLDRPRQASHGDLATNVPLVCARQAGKPPLTIAEELKAHLSLDSEIIPRVEVAAPGFLNFFLADDYFRRHLLTILEQGKDYGKSAIGEGQRALVEFVSANPTGPLTVGHGRGAILGDTVSNILSWNGYQVDREYYYNDAGRQMRLLGQSVWARYSQSIDPNAPFPEDGYQGDYITEISQSLPPSFNPPAPSPDETNPYEDPIIVGMASGYAEEAIFEDIKNTLRTIGIAFDHYFNERSLYQSDALNEVVSALEKKGFVYRKDGATWLKATALDRPEDRVLIKSSGEPTYRLPDIAYHADKLERGYDLVVDIFGADHQDTYPDVLAGVQGLGYDTGNIRVLIHQFVTLTRGGQQVKMSTRKATFVTLEELIAEVGRDVVRYFFIMRGMDSHLQFDLDLARKTSDENPVYYLQYAHARMVNIGKRAEAFGYQLEPDSAPLHLLALPEARTLMHLLWWFPEVVQQVHGSLEPQTMANFLQELATAYHRYYTVARVVTDDRELSTARLVITEACRRTLANGLAILGITAPERM